MTRNHKTQGTTATSLAVALAAGTLTAVAWGGATPALAQQLSAPVNHPAAISALPGLGRHFDIFAGTNKPGPYTLSWNKIEVNRDMPLEVVVDNQTLRASEYTLDAARGLITFKSPLKQTSVARVTYYYDLKASKRNGGAATAPLTVPLMRMAGTNIKVTALPSSDNNKSGFAAPLAFSTGGNSRVAGGKLTSQFNYAGADSLGMEMGYSLGNARNGLDGAYYRADRNLAQRFGQALGVKDAARRWSLASRLTPTSWLGASFTTNKNEDLAKNVQTGQNVLALKLQSTPKSPMLGFTRTENININPAKKKDSSVITDKLDFAATLTASTSLTATGTRTATDVAAPSGDVRQEEGTVVISSVSKDKQTQASVSLLGGGKETAGATEEKNGVSVRLQAAPVFIVTAEKRDITTTPLKPDGSEGDPSTTSTRGIGADIIPMPGAKVTGMLTETSVDDVKVSATVVNAQWGTGKTLEVSGGITNRSTEVPGATALDTTTAQIQLRPTKAITVSGGYVWNPENKGQVAQAQQQQVGIKANLGAWEVGSNYNLTTLNGLADWDDQDPQFGQVSVTLGLRLSRFSKINYSYADSLRYRSACDLPATLVGHYTRTMGLGLTHDTGEALNIALGTTFITNRGNVKEPSDVKAEARIGVKF